LTPFFEGCWFILVRELTKASPKKLNRIYGKTECPALQESKVNIFPVGDSETMSFAYYTVILPNLVLASSRQKT
jgi:hypothetical protein